MKATQTRDLQRPENQWNLSSLYSNPFEFEKHLNSFLNISSKERWDKILSYKGTLHSSIENVKEILDLTTELDRNISKIYTYGFLKHDENLNCNEWKNYFQKVNVLYQDFFQNSSWIEPELIAIPQEVFESFLKQDLLADYAFYFKTLMHKKEFTLSSEKEELISLATVPLSTPQKTFSLFNNVDLHLGKVKDSKGKSHELTHSSYRLMQRSEDRTLRANSFKALHQSFFKFENTLSELLLGHVRQHIFDMKARGYKNCLMSALYTKNIPTKTYHNLIQTVRANIQSLHDFTLARKELLGLDEIHLYDLQVPLCASATKEIPYTQAVEWVIESVAPLGEEYQQALAKGLTEQGWVDIYENQHKRSGAYSSGCYDSHPYILLNYKGTLNDVFTLAHEAGHSMHTFYSHKNQSYQYSHYPIFVAEVASIFNETLLMDYLLKRQTIEEDQINLLHERIEEMRGTLFRQTLFAEFELHLHECLEANNPLTASMINDYYYQLNQDYYGPHMTLDKEVSIEWARVPHFYSNFYVYQYATGISAALTLAYRVLDGEPGAKEAYLKFLSQGGHGYPLELLRVAGVDMESTKPIEKALNIFKELVEKLKKVKKLSSI
ncbi:MAG: Oligoendopeptidase F, plasmid [Chlamydiae bacterium]|nr:Oligoendopeptidase F, plasmid [Chlamydiota bacterium]